MQRTNHPGQSECAKYFEHIAFFLEHGLPSPTRNSGKLLRSAVTGMGLLGKNHLKTRWKIFSKGKFLVVPPYQYCPKNRSPYAMRPSPASALSCFSAWSYKRWRPVTEFRGRVEVNFTLEVTLTGQNGTRLPLTLPSPFVTITSVLAVSINKKKNAQRVPAKVRKGELFLPGEQSCSILPSARH
jgi:hypothetical protein